MRKEILIAVILGGVLGVTIAFGIWRANIAFSTKKAPVQTNAPTAKTTLVSQQAFDLSITDPEEEVVSQEEEITLSGKTSPNITVVISSDTNETTAISDTNGNWKANLKLSPGANAITVLAIRDSGETIEKQLIIVYSTEIKETSFPSPTPAQETATDAGKSVRNTLRERVEKRLEALTNKPRATVGTITDIQDAALLIQVKNGTRQVKLTEGTIIVEIKKNTKKTVSTGDLAIGSAVVAMGFMDTKDILETQRILILEEFPTPKRKVIHGLVEKVEKDKLVVKTSEASWITELEKETRFSGKVDQKENIANEDRVVVIGTQAKKTESFIVADRVHVIPNNVRAIKDLASSPLPSISPSVLPSASPSTKPSAKPSPTPTQ